MPRFSPRAEVEVQAGHVIAGRRLSARRVAAWDELDPSVGFMRAPLFQPQGVL